MGRRTKGEENVVEFSDVVLKVGSVNIVWCHSMKWCCSLQEIKETPSTRCTSICLRKYLWRIITALHF